MSDGENIRAELMRLIEEGEVNAADALIRSLPSDSDLPVELLKVCGNAYLKLGKQDLAANVFHLAVSKGVADEEIYYNIAVCEMAKKNYLAATDAFRVVLSRQPQHLAAILYLAVCCERAGESRSALSAYMKAVRLAESISKANIPTNLRKILSHATEVISSTLADVFRVRLTALTAKYGEKELSRIISGANIFLGVQAPNYANEFWRPALMYIPGLLPRMFYERDELPYLAEIEKATAEIRNEFLHVWTMERGFNPYINHPESSASSETWRELNNSKDWSTYHFYRQGMVYEENCRLCPITADILSRLPLHNVPGYSPEAMFSVLKAHTKIKAHYGPVNGRLIVHLPLIVPENCGAIRVGDEARSWQVGECLIFDDSMKHEAWNNSDELRAVLIFDIWNPQMKEYERQAMTAMLVAAKQFESELLALPF